MNREWLNMWNSSVVGFFWELGNLGKHIFVQSNLKRMGLRPGVDTLCDVNAHGVVAAAFANVAWAILHPWFADSPKFKAVRQ